MSRTGRGRRTRVYDCNYNKGESYYRPVLDRLEGKVAAPPEVPRSGFDARVKNALDNVQMSNDDYLDTRGARAPRGKPLSSAFEDEEFNDEISESLKRLRAGKKSSRFAEDFDFENAVANIDNRVKISDKILQTVGISQSDITGARRTLQENEERTEKRIARRLNEENSLTKWTALKDDETAAAMRAKASRARLNDLEDEMSEMNERSLAREKRVARLRALVAEADSLDNVASARVTVRSEKEKKQVTF